jgi:hypothetical protein
MARKLLDSPNRFLKPELTGATSYVPRRFMRRHATLIAAFAVLLSSCAASRTAGGGGAPTPTAPQSPPVITVKSEPNTIPVGTTLEVRTGEEINSSNAEGRTYQASIATEVVDAQNNVLLPRGSQVELIILEAKEKTGVKGASLQLGMRSVTVNGVTYLVVSEERKETSGLGTNRRTAEVVGGGAALGTLIGAAAGGGKGAVLGGLIGAAAGAAVQVLTQGKEVRIPAESVLRFQLDEPIRLQTR